MATPSIPAKGMQLLCGNKSFDKIPELFLILIGISDYHQSICLGNYSVSALFRSTLCFDITIVSPLIAHFLRCLIRKKKQKVSK